MCCLLCGLPPLQLTFHFAGLLALFVHGKEKARAFEPRPPTEIQNDPAPIFYHDVIAAQRVLHDVMDRPLDLPQLNVQDSKFCVVHTVYAGKKVSSPF